MARRLALGCTIALGALLVPVAPAAAETKVGQKGPDITITIPVDVVGATDKFPTAPNGQPLVDYWKQILNESWGAAFKTMRYKDCYLFQLKVDLKARRASFDSTEGRHRILVGAPTGGLTFKGTGFDGVRETSSNHRTGDGTGSMENDRDGAVPVDAPPRVVSHEFGHLFGLGQDFVDKGRPIDTVMVGGEAPNIDLTLPGRVDQNLVNRLGEIVERYLKDQGKKLSPCTAYKGPITTSYNATGPGGVSCTGEENGTVTLGVAAGQVTGTIDTSGSSTCTGPAGSITDATASLIRLTGSFEDKTLTLGYIDVVGDRALTPNCLVEFPIEIPVERGMGSAELMNNQVAGYNITCNLTVEREPDEDEPVG